MENHVAAPQALTSKAVEGVMPIYLEAEPGKKYLRIGLIMLEKSRPQHAGHRFEANPGNCVDLLLGLDRQDGLDRLTVDPTGNP
jgi:hypothetical protein